MSFELPPLKVIAFVALALFLLTGVFLGVLDLLTSRAAKTGFLAALFSIFAGLAWLLLRAG
jgi:hypothetical protein